MTAYFIKTLQQFTVALLQFEHHKYCHQLCSRGVSNTESKQLNHSPNKQLGNSFHFSYFNSLAISHDTLKLTKSRKNQYLMVINPGNLSMLKIFLRFSFKRQSDAYILKNFLVFFQIWMSRASAKLRFCMHFFSQSNTLINKLLRHIFYFSIARKTDALAGNLRKSGGKNVTKTPIWYIFVTSHALFLYFNFLYLLQFLFNRKILKYDRSLFYDSIHITQKIRLYVYNTLIVQTVKPYFVAIYASTTTEFTIA